MLDRVIFGAQVSHLGGLVAPFGTLGGHLDDLWIPGDTPQDTLGSRSGFLLILGGFGDAIGSHFGLILAIFCDLGV